MSLDIIRAEDAKHPQHLQENINSSCFEATQHNVAALKAAGHDAALMCKTAGEGQYTPPGFVPFDVIGLDGKKYRCTGFSHDAIWCDGKQFDTIGAGNDSPNPIYRDPVTGEATFEPIGPRIVGVPTWNPIPQQYWRPNNPPYTGSVTLPPIPPQPAPVVPGREEALDEMNWLDWYYTAPEGLQRPNGLSLNGKPDFLGIAAWYLDVYQQERIKGKSRADARAKYVSDIRHSDEWKQKHPGETP